MSVFPYFSNVNGTIVKKLQNRQGKIQSISSLNAWVRVSSGVGSGLSIISNPNFSLLKAAGDGNNASLYGGGSVSGVIGTTWGGGAVYASSGQGYRPSPIIESLEIDEGAGNLSRKASFTITAFSKEQMESLLKYFLEPGYTIFLEWGWNTAASMEAWSGTLDASTVASYQSFKQTQTKRAAGGYEYDNYLGFITGGGLSQDGDKWKIEVKCTGFVELPAYLVVNETGKSPVGCKVEPPFGPSEITAAQNNPTKLRFMMMFNELPKTRRTDLVKALQGQVTISDLINWDSDIASAFNSKTEGALGSIGTIVKSLFGAEWGQATANVDGEEVDLPVGTMLVPEQKFIRFGFLMKIINSIAVDYKLSNGKKIKLKIKTNGQPIGAYQNIFSSDIERLFIPNGSTPKFSLGDVSSFEGSDGLGNAIVTISSTIDNKVGTVQFPQTVSLSKSIDGGDTITKSANQWGYLDDLYVNFDFVKGILETDSFVLKDAMYQILNGMSSAVNGLWDFQIVELPESTEDTTVLTVVDLNFTPQSSGADLVLEAIGANSIFIDSSFTMDMGGAMMDHIIGERLESGTNSQTKGTNGLFADEKDLVLNEIEDISAAASNTSGTGNGDGTGTGTGETAKTADELAQENLELFLGNITLLPKVEISDKDAVPGGSDLYEGLYLGAFKDSQLQINLKTSGEASNSDVSPLLPINFSFVIHGISGIKRGDKFKINGLPSKYNDGFFQVLSVKHTIDGMLWKTEVTGGYRHA